ncbi:MAG: hypothetical protein OEW60_02135 [Thiovulaceae bacterium]|nr:hypothetical protein [Sulfurimonadaceae bacterium]
MSKIRLILLTFLSLALPALANSDKKFYENYHYKVMVKSSLESSVKDLKKYLTSVRAQINTYNKTKSEFHEQIEIDFVVSKNSKITLKKTLEKLGNLELISFEKIDFEDAIAKGRYQKALLDEMKKEYKSEFKALHQVKDTQSMRKTIDLIHKVDKDIYEQQKQIKAYKNDQNFHHYKVVLQAKLFSKKAPRISADGKIIDSNETDDRSVFIPSSAGIGYSLLQIELPVDGYSSAYYSGYEIKYMFNKDEQHLKIVTMNATTLPTITTEINDLFFISYGRNFYPLRFRSGRNILTNIYSGVDVGMYLASTVADVNSVRLFGTVHLGYELYSNDYFFLDTKIAYFLPFWSPEIINLRGIMYGLSFNLKL